MLCLEVEPPRLMPASLPAGRTPLPGLQLCLQKHPEHVARIMEADDGTGGAAAAEGSPAAEAAGGAGSSGGGAAAAAATPRPAE